MEKKLLEHFTNKELQKKKKKKKKNQKELRIEKVIKRKGNRLYVKTKGYNNLFKGQIDKKDRV